jgi:hypothetical protein
MEILLFVIPIWLVARWSISLARERQDQRYGWGLFGIATSIMAVIDAAGFFGYQESAARKRWTAASFNLAVSLLLCALVALAAWVVRQMLGRRPR